MNHSNKRLFYKPSQTLLIILITWLCTLLSTLPSYAFVNDKNNNVSAQSLSPNLAKANLATRRPTLLLGTSDNSAFGSEYDTYKGYFNEIVRAVLDNSKLSAQVDFYPYSRALSMLRGRQVHGVYPIRRNKNDQTNFIYSLPLPSSSMSLLKRKSTHLYDPKSITSIGVLTGESLPTELQNKGQVSVVFGSNHISLLKMLELNRVDAVLIDRYSASELLVRETPGLIGNVEFDKTYEISNQFYFAMNKSEPNAKQTIEAFNSALNKLKREGVIDDILSRYGVYAVPPAEPSKTQLVVASPQLNYTAYAKYLANEFEKQNPNVQIIWRVFEENIFRRRLLSNFALNSREFDLVLVGPYELKNWLHYDWFEPLNTLSKQLDLNDYFPPVRDAVFSGKDLYALPFNGETTVLYYRKDILDKHNITLPTRLTFDQLIPILNTVHAPQKGIHGIGLRTRPGWGQNMALVSILVNSYGGSWFDANNQINVLTPEWRGAVQLYIQLLQRFGLKKLANLGWQENQSKFENGEFVFFIDASSLASQIFDPQHSIIAEKVQMTQAPFVNSPQGSRWFWSWNFAIPAQSQNKKLAKAFIRFASEAKPASLQTGVIPPSGIRRSSYKNNGHMTQFPFAKFEYDLLNNTKSPKFETTVGRQYAETFYFPTIGYHTGYEIHRALLGEISVDEALQNAQNKINKLLSKKQLLPAKATNTAPSQLN